MSREPDQASQENALQPLLGNRLCNLKSPAQRITWQQKLFAVTFGGLILFFFVDSLTAQLFLTIASNAANNLIEQDYGTIVAAILVFGIVSPLVGIPFSLLPCATSIILRAKTGDFWGSYASSVAISVLAPTVGGILSFIIARSVLVSFAGYLKSKYRVYRAIERVLADHSQSVQIQLLLRLSPLLPTAAINIVLGATENCHLVPEYVSALVLGSLAYAVPLSYVGCLLHALTDLEDNDDLDLTSPIGMAMAIVGGVASVAVTISMTCYTRNKLKVILAQERDSEHDQMRESTNTTTVGTTKGPTMV